MASGIQAKIQEVVGRVLTDPAYAEEIRKAGFAAIRGGAGSEAWDQYFEYFASTPGELAGVGASDSASCTCNSSTVTTTSTLVTPIPTCCGSTVTTTTSGNNFAAY
jgi:hypothetical protein